MRSEPRASVPIPRVFALTRMRPGHKHAPHGMLRDRHPLVDQRHPCLRVLRRPRVHLCGVSLDSNFGREAQDADQRPVGRGQDHDARELKAERLQKRKATVRSSHV